MQDLQKEWLKALDKIETALLGEREGRRLLERKMRGLKARVEKAEVENEKFAHQVSHLVKLLKS